jgi:golgin subfamily B member 1
LEQLLSSSGRGKRKDKARFTFRLGTIAEARDDMDKAREHFDKAYRLDSTYGPTLVALGRIHMAQEDWSNVRRIYRSMLLQNIDENAGISKEDIFYHLGLAHLELDETSKALSMFERGLEVAPEHDGILAAMERAKG